MFCDDGADASFISEAAVKKFQDTDLKLDQLKYDDFSSSHLSVDANNGIYINLKALKNVLFCGGPLDVGAPDKCPGCPCVNPLPSVNLSIR